MLVINDIHIGVKRVAGTTPESAAKLRNYLLETYEQLLHLHDDVLVNGDMFDTYNIPLSDLLNAYSISAEWLQQDSKRRLRLVPGNHCLSKSSVDLSSFELMARLLVPLFPNQVSYLQGGGWVDEDRGIYVISHVVNQAEFDLQVSRVPASAKFLMLHANFSSPFAEHSDHSLNLSSDQARSLIDKGATLIFGHEHLPRTLFGGKLRIPGNQRPSSVADCVTPDGRAVREKTCLLIQADGSIETIPTWSQNDVHGFRDIPWNHLEGETLLDAESFEGFIRISGKAEPEEVAEALKRISRLRQKSSALVITNAVRAITRDSGVESIAESIEDVRKVDVVQLVLDTLTPEQAEVVRAVLEKA